MLDLEVRLRRYADDVERRYPDITVEEIVGDLRHSAPLRRLPMLLPRPAIRRSLAIVLAAAVVVLVLVGAVALFVRVIGAGPAPVVTDPDGTPTTVEPSPEPEPDTDGGRVLETSLGTWVWTYVGEGYWEVGRTLLEGLYDPPALTPELTAVPLPHVDGMEWRPRLYGAASARSGGITVTIVPVEGHVDWNAFYTHEAGWVEGNYGPFTVLAGTRDEYVTFSLTPGRRIELPATLEIVAWQSFPSGGDGGEHRSVGVLATLEVSVVPGDPETVEYRDRDTGDLVLRLAATDPELPAEQLVRAGHSCSWTCPVSLWRLFVEGAESTWVDPPWLGLAVDRLAIAAVSEGFVIAAVAESAASPPTLHAWASADGMVWEEFRPPQPIDIPAGADVDRLQLVGGGDLLVASMRVLDIPRGWSLVWTSTDRSEWQPAQMDRPGVEVDHVALTPHGGIMVGNRPSEWGPRCEVFVSADGVRWEQVALPPGRATDMSQCHIVGDTVALGVEQILDWGAYAAGEEVEFLEHWWRGEFDK